MRRTGPTYCTKHGAGYRYFREVPRDIQPIIGTRRWIKWLGRIIEPDAITAARALAHEHDNVIKAVRLLTPQDRAQIIALGGLAKLQTRHDNVQGASNIMAALANVDVAFQDSDAPEQALIVAEAKRDAKALRKRAGEFKVLISRATPEGGGSMDALVTAWQKSAAPRSPNVVKRMQRYARKFSAFVNALPPQQVTSVQARAWRNELEKDSTLAREAVRQHLTGLHRMFGIGISEGIVAEPNPFTGVKARVRGVVKFADDGGRKAFTRQQVRAMLDAADNEPADFRLVLRTLAYHGARSTEICQLRGEDVARVGDVLTINIHDRFGQIKNKHSVRVIPVHSACAKDLEALAITRRGQWLFASYGRERDAGGRFQQQASPFIRKRLGIVDPKLTAHSLRKTWRTFALAVGMEEPVSRSIMGHSLGGGEHNVTYAKGVPVEKMAEWLERVKF